MADLELSFAITPYDRVQPLITGEVKPQGIRLEFVDMPVPDIFYRQLKFSQFDISEMSFSFFLIGRSRGWAYRALPVFHNRQFVYTTMLVHADAGIRTPKDLKGKRIGVFDYQQTGAVHLRGQLQHEFGVRPEDMEWYMERTEHGSIGGALGEFKPPAGLNFHYATTDLATMFLRRELDAGEAIRPHGGGASLERPKEDIRDHPKLQPLFSNPREEAVRYFKKTGIFPVHHTTVVRESILEQHPWVASSLLEAFEKAKRLALERSKRYPMITSLFIFGRQEQNDQRLVFGDDPNPYGIKVNAEAIDTLQLFLVEQQLTPGKQPWDELFAAEVLLMEEKFA